MKTLTIALRQVLRSRRRTLVTVGAMAFAGITMIFYASLMEGFMSSMERLALSTDTGDLQIHAEGYLDDPNLYSRIEEPGPILAALEAKGLKAAPRLFGFGLVAAGTSSGGAVIRGVDTVRQPAVTTLHETVDEGAWLDAKAPGEVVIGRKLAKTLGVGLGGEIVLLSQDSQGFMANDLYKVRGVLGTVSEVVDRAGVFMVESAFRELMAVETGCHEIVVMRVDQNADLMITHDQVMAAAPKQDVKTWRMLLPVLATMLENSDVGLVIMIVITYVAVAMVILNAMLMSVFERIREFGVMKAIGVPPWQVSAIIMLEALFLGLMASVLAVAAGVPLSLYYESVGIDLSSFIDGVTMGGVAVDPIWRANVTPRTVLEPIGYLFFITIGAVIYPAIKAALIRPVDAIRHR